jgi:nitronate monooxygenase
MEARSRPFPRTRVAELLGVRYPIVQAPMAGGFTTPQLVAAVSEAGGLGSIGAAMLGPEELRDAIAAVRRLTSTPFAVNVFAELDPVEADAGAVAAMDEVLAPFRTELGLPERERPAPASPPPGRVREQIAVVAEERVPVLSFTFGIPPLDAVKAAGGIVLGTATTVAEAVELEARGVDAVVAQGSEAGGHRGTFLGAFEAGLVGGLALVPQVVDRVSVPVVAAGGMMDGRGIAAALALGAEGVQLGTAFLGCPESGSPPGYREALAEASDTATGVTAAYTGRPARALRTRLIDAVERSGVAPLPYPLQGMLLQDVRAAATARGPADLLFLLAGQGAGMLRSLSAGDLVESLVRETGEAIDRLARS